MIIEFYDNKKSFGFIEVNDEPLILKKVKELTKEYKLTDKEEYNLEDLYRYLRDKGIKFKIIPTEADESIYF